MVDHGQETTSQGLAHGAELEREQSPCFQSSCDITVREVLHGASKCAELTSTLDGGRAPRVPAACKRLLSQETESMAGQGIRTALEFALKSLRLRPARKRPRRSQVQEEAGSPLHESDGH